MAECDIPFAYLRRSGRPSERARARGEGPLIGPNKALRHLHARHYPLENAISLFKGSVANPLPATKANRGLLRGA